MHRVMTGLAAGVLYGLGLSVSKLIDPATVIQSLDWGRVLAPRLPLTMGIAAFVAGLGFVYARRWRMPPLRAVFQWRRTAARNDYLVPGCIVYGLGWGLGGYCPGPAIAGLGVGVPMVWLFVAAMILGMGLWDYLRGEAPVLAAGE